MNEDLYITVNSESGPIQYEDCLCRVIDSTKKSISKELIEIKGRLDQIESDMNDGEEHSYWFRGDEEIAGLNRELGRLTAVCQMLKHYQEFYKKDWVKTEMELQRDIYK